MKRKVLLEKSEIPIFLQSQPITTQSVGEEVLEGAGKISHKKAMEKAEGEYRKYQVKTLSSVEKAYIEEDREKIPALGFMDFFRYTCYIKL